jgi:outer membrane protein insertion porin family
VGVRHNFDKFYSVDHDRQKINITIFIKERRKVTVNFVDRSHASEKELKEVLTFNDSGTYDEVEIRRSAQAIQHLYQTKGYFNAVVYSKSYMIKDDRLKVEFYIQPGDQFRVGYIKFKCKYKHSNYKLKGEIVTKVFPKKLALIGLGSGGYITPKQLEQDKKRLIKLYQKQGYKNIKVDVDVISSKNKIPSSVETINSLLPRKKKKIYIGVVFKVEEGKQILFKNLDYEGVKASDLKAIKKIAGVSKNVPFSKNLIKQDLKKFGRYFANNGYPYNTITTNISTDLKQQGIELKFQIKYGPRVKFGSIFIKGNFKTRDSVVKRELSFDQGDEFSLSSVEKTARNLRSLGVFRSVRVKFMGLKDKQKIIHVIIQLIERYDDSGELEVGGGFSTDNLYFASLSYKNHNLFGLAKSIELKGEIGAEIQSGRFTFQDSRFLGTRLLFQVTGYGRSEETVRLGDIITYGASVTLRKSWSQRFQWFLRYVIRHVSYKESLYRVGGGADESSRVNFATTTASIGPTVIWDKRDNPLVPRKGYRLTSSVRVASKYLGGDDDFFHINMTGQVFIDLPFKFILAQGFRYDHGIPFRNTNVLPKVERFFAGGDTTVRGYEEDQLFTQLVETPISPYGSGYVYSIKPVGGNIRLLSNTELQFPIWEKSILLNMPIWGAFFFDTGYLVNSYQNLTLGIFHSGYGAALRVVTPVGVISIEYAFPLKKVWGSDPDGRVHFNFGFIF